jgi:tetratricopeptide (TPR) repeat protein
MFQRFKLVLRLMTASLLLFVAEALAALNARRLTLRLYQCCFKLWPENRAGVLMDLAHAHSRMGAADEALRAARDAILLRPEDPWMYLSLAAIAESHGQIAVAIESYERVLQQPTGLTAVDKGQVRSRLESAKRRSIH